MEILVQSAIEAGLLVNGDVFRIVCGESCFDVDIFVDKGCGSWGRHSNFEVIMGALAGISGSWYQFADTFGEGEI